MEKKFTPYVQYQRLMAKLLVVILDDMDINYGPGDDLRDLMDPVWDQLTDEEQSKAGSCIERMRVRINAMKGD